MTKCDHHFVKSNLTVCSFTFSTNLFAVLLNISYDKCFVITKFSIRFTALGKDTEQKLEQLERLRSEDTPRRLMISHTIESYWIPSQKKIKSKLQI